MSTYATETALVKDERGFGMVEILVSMLLLGIVAIAFLPLLIQGLKVSQLNTTTATATQLVNQQADGALATPQNCDAFVEFMGRPLVSVTDPRGVVLTPHITGTTTCPTVYPATVSIRVYVTNPSGSVVAETTALILLQKAHA
ncbi:MULTISPECIES: type IV pilus modification PilV family protein [unclassified Leifsonia]|uniref:type IV pilus modification PilV family protein n=1 Tax=unclassified Leifsonia TaxID=2663824 RepID=UPI000700D1B2|nr:MULTISPECIES: prepilin-type N-terminal cleavage/methylation domain-containing protein [unclassified Leifsonia]KQX07960.1 hypothetical protein ASC59_09675 [Leifsonia sp. Root1293]KRA12241.1 hypothetical protein ASD61_09675 [Leifsonia sp. Root60]